MVCIMKCAVMCSLAYIAERNVKFAYPPMRYKLLTQFWSYAEHNAKLLCREFLCVGTEHEVEHCHAGSPPIR